MQHLLAGEGSARPEFPALVVNWHVTEACNYRCAYCYAQWEAPDRKEIIRNRRDTEALVRAIHAGFSGSPTSDALRTSQPARRVRLNFAGGEPLLFASRVLEAMQIARELELDVSLITNGSRLTPALMEKLAPLLTILGVSIDALDRESNLAIGRGDCSGRVPDVNDLADLLRLARSRNPDLRIKVNTVVNARNWHLDLTPLVQAIAPDRWKVLRMLPSTTTQLAIDRQQFEHFVSRHVHLRGVMRVEDNDDMTESYLMVDPHGRFFQNGRPAAGYSYSPAILDVGADAAAQTISWSPVKFATRYRRDVERRR